MPPPPSQTAPPADEAQEPSLPGIPRSAREAAGPPGSPETGRVAGPGDRAPDPAGVGRRIRGIVFDMDGVLCDSEELMAEASCAMFRETHGVSPSTSDFHEFMGRGSESYFGGVGRKHGVTAVLPRDRDRTYEIFREVIRGRLRPLPGVLEFTTAARSAGIRLAVATSADPIKLDAILVEIGLPHATFDALVTAEDVTHNKPDPEIFVHAMARLGLPPADCVVVEDTLPGITAALGSGARCLALHTTFPRDRIEPLRPRWIAPDLAHLPADFLRECGMA